MGEAPPVGDTEPPLLLLPLLGRGGAAVGALMGERREAAAGAAPDRLPELLDLLRDTGWLKLARLEEGCRPVAAAAAAAAEERLGSMATTVPSSVRLRALGAPEAVAW